MRIVVESVLTTDEFAVLPLERTAKLSISLPPFIFIFNFFIFKIYLNK